MIISPVLLVPHISLVASASYLLIYYVNETFCVVPLQSTMTTTTQRRIGQGVSEEEDLRRSRTVNYICEPPPVHSP